MDFEKLKIKEYSNWTLYLHKNQYYLGRSFVRANREDAREFLEINKDERNEFFEVSKKFKEVLEEIFSPGLINYAIFRNEARHLHVHLIPRYRSKRKFDGIEFVDENWGGNYAPYDRDFQVPKSTLFKIRDKISENI